MERPHKKIRADLMPKDLCPAMVLKHLLTHGLDEEVFGDRRFPGDGYYWCARTCTCVGPDDEVVHPSTCLPGRSCHDGPQA
ncbi:MAG: hypothetical protein JNM25_00255 [Planctomycetes bacterium]|nr:hypothetical protein [Planctomycetota bacterium]